MNQSPRTAKLAVLPIIVANMYSVSGVLLFNWSVADLFFWFWCEFVLAGITTFALLASSSHIDKPFDSGGTTIFVFGFSFLLILVFATMFAGLAFKGEWKSWERFPIFFADKKIGLIATALAYALLFLRAVTQRDYRVVGSNVVSVQFGRKMWVVLALYVIFLLHGWVREWTTGARSLDLSSAYIKGMGVLLLALKFMVELGVFDKLANRRRVGRRIL